MAYPSTQEPTVIALPAVAVDAQTVTPNEIGNLTRNSKVTQNTVIAVHHVPIPGYLVAVDVLLTSGAYQTVVPVVTDRGQFIALLTWRAATRSECSQPIEGQGVRIFRVLRPRAFG